MKKLVALTALMLLTFVAFAQNPVGAWKGKVIIDRAAVPKLKDPQQQKMMDQTIAQAEKMAITLTMRSNKTFTMVIPPFMGSERITAEGTWSQKGKEISLVTTKTNGQPPREKEKSQPMTISTDGKRMTLAPSSFSGMGKTRISFSK